MTENISSFSDEYRFLSNFYPSEITIDNLTYKTVEHAYQASKALHISDKRKIQESKSPGEAKRLGRTIQLIPDWENKKLTIMEFCLRQKFLNLELKTKLINTKDSELIEGNNWGDRYWGQSPIGNGKNMLGILLMKIRNEL